MGALDRVFRSRRPSQNRPVETIIGGLWRNGEQGWWLDRNDLSTMYQDAAGTVPVYQPGQGQVDPPVALALDKRFGLARGPEIFSDSTVSLLGESVRISPGVYRVYSSAGAYSGVSIPITPNTWYEISLTVDAAAATGGGLVVESVQNPSTTTTGRKAYLVFSTIGAVVLKRGAGVTDFQVSNVSIRRLYGNHAYELTTTSRPKLTGRYNRLQASEKFDDAYWGFTSNYSVEKTAEVMDPAGRLNAWKITSVTGVAALNKVVGSGFRNPIYTVVIKAGSRNPDILVRNATTSTNLVAGSTTSPSSTSAYGRFTNAPLVDGWKQLTIEITSGVAVGDSLIVYLGSTGSVASGQFFYVFRADMREAGDAVGMPGYQRVVDPNNYDTAGFALYLQPDGIDDIHRTAAINFGSSAVTVATAIRRDKDSGLGCVVEATTNYANSDGTLILLAPGVSDTASVSWNAKGNILAGGMNIPTPAAPAPAVVVASANISSARRSLSVNSDSTTSSASIGTGAFGNHVCHFFQRGSGGMAFSGRDYASICVARELTAPELAAVRKYLNARAKGF